MNDDDVDEDISRVEKLWDEAIAMDGDPPPEVTLRGLSSAAAPHHVTDVWGSVFESAPPLTTGAAAFADDDAHSLGAGLAIRISRVSMRTGGMEDVGRFANADGDDFLIVDELGRGGMGVVYKARQSSLDRTVAVKMIAPSIAGNEGARRKMMSEALVIGALDHPNIIPIHDLGRTEQNNLFYAMKMAGGTPWSARIKTLTPRENLNILMRVADAAAFAHDKGIIHRDLKPGNVMLGEYGEVFLTDWGLAVSADPSSKAELLTPLNAMAGTPAYMAPEMARGKTAKIDSRSDIYLLGGILYEIVTGAMPHPGESSRACLLAAAMNEIAPSAVSDDLLHVALRAMETEPEDRYRTVKEFQGAIEAVETHRESLAMISAAESYLAQAEAGDEYADYSRAVFAFREAARLWPKNGRAEAGEAASRKKFAVSALKRHDYDLALENLSGLEDQDSRALHDQVRRAKNGALLRRKRIRLLSFAAVGLTAAVVIILAAATAIVSDRMTKEQEARLQARLALEETSASLGRERLASIERERALRSEKEALLREMAAREERLAALDRAEAERRRKEEAEQARLALADEMSRKGQLEDASWWAFDALTAAARQREAAVATGPIALDVPLPSGDMAFSLIPAGEFVMGSPPRSAWHAPDEYLHRVAISIPFYMGKTEVTRAQWRTVVGVEDAETLMPVFNPLLGGESEEDFRAGQLDVWGWRTLPVAPDEADLPATGISARDIDTLFLPAFAPRAPAGWDAALPSEAQWEYAARSGSPRPYYGHREEGVLDLPGWTRENSGFRLHRAGELPANAWGLVDMHGNAGEIVRDLYGPDYYLSSPLADPVNDAEGAFRVYRGGNVLHSGAESLAASRHRIHPDNRYAQIGFRLSLQKKR